LQVKIIQEAKSIQLNGNTNMCPACE